MAAPMKVYNLLSGRAFWFAKCTYCIQTVRSKYVLPRNVQGVREILSTLINRTAICSLLRNYATTNEQTCWKCQRELDLKKERFFCNCGVVQPPLDDLSYFQLFKLEKSFDIDTSTLTKLFRRLQMLLHPDKYTQKSSVSTVFLTSSILLVYNHVIVS